MFFWPRLAGSGLEQSGPSGVSLSDILCLLSTAITTSTAGLVPSLGHQSGMRVAPASIGNATGVSDSHWARDEPWLGDEEEHKSLSLVEL